MPHLSPSQQATCLRALADAIDQGHPADVFRVGSDGAVVIANPISAARWKAHFGDEIAGFPLAVFEVDLLREAS